MKRQVCAALLLIITAISYAQIKVVSIDLKGINGVQLFKGKMYLGISDEDGIIKIDTSSIKEDTWLLTHPGYYPKRINQNELRGGTTFILNRKTNTFAPVLVTTDRGTRYNSEIPENVSTLGSKYVDLYQPPTAADLLQAHQTVYVQKSQLGGGSPMIRGFATNRILLVVDNVRMNTAIFRAGNVHNIISIDPFSVESSSVIFGPSSQFYGSDAIGGVISFKTKSLEFSDSIKSFGNVGLRYGTAADENTWHFDYGLSSKNFTSYSSISFSRFQDLRIGTDGPEVYTRPDFAVYANGQDTLLSNPDRNVQVFSGYNQLNLLQKFKVKINDRNDLTAAIHFSATSDIPRYDRLILRDEADGLANGNWYYGPQKWSMTYLSWKHIPTGKWADSITTTAALQTFEESRNDRKFGENQRRERTENLNAYSLNIDAEKKLNTKTKLSYGLEIVQNTLQSVGQRRDIATGEIQQIASRYPDGSDWMSAGTYGHVYHRWNARHISEAGFRLSSVRTTGSFDTSLTPLYSFSFDNQNEAITGSLSHLWKLGKHHFGLVISTAFRSPNIDDISKVFDSNPGIVTVPNPNLKPEYAYNGELNYTVEAMDRIKINTSLFYTYLNNALALAPATLNGSTTVLYDDTLNRIQRLSNQDYALVYGAQLGVQVKFTNYLMLKSNYTLLSSSSSNDEPIRHITPNFGATSIEYTKNKWVVVAYAQYNQRFDFEQFTLAEQQDEFLYAKDSSGLPYSPAWYTLNARVVYKLHARVSLNAAIENILDKRYRPYSSGLTAPGRNIILSLQARI